MISRHGCPQILINNNKNYLAESLKKLLKFLGTSQHFIVPYSPYENGMIKKIDGLLILILKKIAVKQPSQWINFLVPPY